MATSPNTRALGWLGIGMALGLLLAACAPQSLQRPNGVAVADDGSLYVMDFGHYRVAHIAAQGRLLGAFGQLGTGQKDILFGWDLALGPDGNLYFCNIVSDDERTRHDGVKVFTPAGVFVREIGATDYKEFAETAHKPYGLDIDAAGRVYVGDDGTATVRLFAPDGELLATFFGNASEAFQLSGINDVAVDDQRQLLYVVDYVQSHVEQFEIVLNAGQWQVKHRLSIGSYGRGPGELAFPQNIAVADDTGRVYVGDTANRRIQVFEADGAYVTEFAPPGVADWQAMGMNLGADGTLYVADSLNGVIWAFTSTGEFVRRIEVQP